MIALIPYQKFEIKAQLDREAIQQKLAEIVEPRNRLRGVSHDHLPFEGKVEGYFFKISRIINYNNAFLPILVGHIYDNLGASILKITARPVFVMLVWPLAGLAGLISAPTLLYMGELTFLWAIFPVFFFFYGVPTILFSWELNKAKKILNELLEVDKYYLP